ncbi:MAG TPA: hypothetical protein PK734_01545 [Bacteroidales bacterium]|mgnify:FL=1|nr:hypothetical protein [Bacteroidales bacterium]
MYLRIYIIAILTTCMFQAHAQFYNGTQMSFGKNRVQYHEPFWRYYRYQEFDVYYDKAGKQLAEFVAKHAIELQQEVKQTIQLQYSRRIIFVVYNSLEYLKQSNIGLSTSDDQYNVGGTTQIIDNKIVLYFNGDHTNLQQQIRKGIALLMIREFLYGTENYRQIISNSALHNFPDWFVNGMAEYASNSWNPIIEEQVINGFASNTFKNIVHVQSYDAEILGHAIWKFIGEIYGKQAISNILFVAKVTENIDEAFTYVIKKNISEVVIETEKYFKEKRNISHTKIENTRILKLARKTKKQPVTHICLSPDASKIAYVTNKSGKISIYITSLARNKHKKIYTTGSVIEQIIDYTYPSIAWHPRGESCTFFVEKKGTIYMYTYIIQDKELIDREFHYFEKVLDFEYAKDGNTIVFSGVKNGQTDVYTYNLQTYAHTQLTNDIADDRYPIFIQNDSKILFSSNRNSPLPNQIRDSARTTYDLYILPKTKNAEVQRLENTVFDNEYIPREFTPGSYMYISDKNGIQNLYRTTPDSSIHFIDTTIHYRYFHKTHPITNSANNIVYYSLAPQTKQILLYSNQNKKKLFEILPLESLTNQNISNIQTTHYKYVHDTTLEFKFREQQYRSQSNTILYDHIDYTAYTFEFETNPSHYVVDSIFSSDSSYSQIRIPRLYETNFYINQIVNQVDFGFINTSYQAFTGNAFYYMPGMNAFFKFGVIDLFEDYRLTGGVRFTGNLQTNEFLISIENLIHRWDKQVLFHKQSLLTYSAEGTSGGSVFYHKLQDYNTIVLLKYPFNQIQSFIFSPHIRYNKDVVVSTDVSSLAEPTQTHMWAGISCKYIFDNTTPKALNILYGTRAKVFAELYSDVTNLNAYLTVFGFDIRKYTPIYKNFIFAQRLAYSYSFGKTPLLYYLGSVDNWINIIHKNETFNTSIEYDRSVDWTYQAIGTNMRGFNQNIRNGPSFGVCNNELRLPVFQNFVKRPIASDFWANFQIIGFFDIGAAWAGMYPGNKENAYNYLIIDNQPIHIVVDEMRSPFVYGYGYGIRSRLFGYFLRLDWARGVDDGITQKIFYLSLSLDF